jgi:predicted phage terminase large subunit-like protein
LSENLNSLSPTKLEFLARQKARTSFLEWCRVCGYEPAKHHKLIIAELELLVENLIKALLRGREVPEEKLRLMVLTPPGSAKSTYISKLFPPWFLAQISRVQTLVTRQGNRFEPFGILACSHNAELATDFGRAARNLISNNQRWLGFDLNKDSRAADKWSITNGGYYQAAGVNSGISGRRMHMGVIDDFCGAETEATSKLFNDQTWIWFENDFVPRLQPISARVIIANHRNEDDLVGRLMGKEADKWRLVRLRLVIETKEQAADDPLGRAVGEFLWPEYFTKEQVTERMQNPRASGIQQQEPSPEKGGFFQADWFQEYHSVKDLTDGRFYAASDHAISLAETADPTCMGLGVMKSGRLYLHPDLVWERLGSKEAVDEMLRLVKTYKPIYWWAEKGHISKSIGPFLQDRMIDERAFANIVEVTPSKDKMTRAQSVNGMMKMGLVVFPSFAPWYQRARRELLMFPNGKHDDFVDFLAHLGNGVNHMISASARQVVTPSWEPNKPWHPTVKWMKDSCDAKSRLLIASRRDD